ncbi:surfactant-associated protein 2 isoform X1 [Vombatus ursinus]|uniref:surfactant-associated protein 2 isoform X1 n=1 Tax=Vombatus ursinus TaxID=29139 RepID=UPI000FFD5748|nr:surfactant-associated protein 2 isoform X1 [Vombatus ursinus]
MSADPSALSRLSAGLSLPSHTKWSNQPLQYRVYSLPASKREGRRRVEEKRAAWSQPKRIPCHRFAMMEPWMLLFLLLILPNKPQGTGLSPPEPPFRDQYHPPKPRVTSSCHLLKQVAECHPGMVPVHLDPKLLLLPDIHIPKQWRLGVNA